MFLVKVSGGKCTHGSEFSHYECNTMFSLLKAPEDLIVELLIFPTILSKIIKSLPWKVVLVSYFISFVTIASVIFGFGMLESTRVFIFFTPVSLFAMFEYRRQDIDVYSLSMYQVILLNRLKQDADVNECQLRYMISNVAHDLKTVRFSCIAWFVCY